MTLDEVLKQRSRLYGKPEVNHSRTLRLWQAFLDNKPSKTLDSMEDVCWLNILQKIAREQKGSEIQDNLDDICGYVENIRMLWEAKK